MKKFGFVVHKGFVFPCTIEDQTVTAHDLSGFRGSWLVKPPYKVFYSKENKTLCEETLEEANRYNKEYLGGSYSETRLD